MRRSGFGLVVALLVAVGCGWPGSDPGAGGDVEQACVAYVAHVNTLEPCTGVTYDPGNLCRSADQQPLAMAAFYDCLREHARCEPDRAVVGGPECPPPIVPLQESRVAEARPEGT